MTAVKTEKVPMTPFQVLKFSLYSCNMEYVYCVGNDDGTSLPLFPVCMHDQSDGGAVWAF